MMMVNTEGKVGGTDLQNDLAFHSAEGGIETMYSNLSAVFQNTMVTQASQICAVGLPPPMGRRWSESRGKTFPWRRRRVARQR